MVCLTLLHLEQCILGQMSIESDYMAFYPLGGVVFKTLNDETCSLFRWLIPRSIQVKGPRVNDKLTDFLSCNHLGTTEWCLLEEVVLQLFQLWSSPQADLCAFQPEPLTFPSGFVRPVIHW